MASVTVKCTGSVQQYTGEGEFSGLLKKLERLTQLQKVKELASFLPWVFSGGGASAVYKGLSTEIKAGYKQLQQALIEVFSTHPLGAYESFINIKLIPEESVDVFVANLVRLGSLVDGSKSDWWLKSDVINGLPASVKQQIKDACSIERMDFTRR